MKNDESKDIEDLIENLKEYKESRDKERMSPCYNFGWPSPHRGKVEVTDKGIIFKDKLNIPYSSITECSCRDGFICILRFVDSVGKNGELLFSGMAMANRLTGRFPASSFFAPLNLYKDIHRFSQLAGNKIPQMPSEMMLALAKALSKLTDKCEFIEPDAQQTKASGSVSETHDFWEREVGGFKLTGSYVERIKLIERGSLTHTWVSVYPAPLPVKEVGPTCHYGVDFVVQGDPGSDIACTGKPKKRFPMGTVDYTWEGDKLADRLNQDTHLRKALTKAKVPEMAIKANRIHTEGFPSLKLFRCIDMVAKHLREEASL